jgi:hypothetical protein
MRPGTLGRMGGRGAHRAAGAVLVTILAIPGSAIAAGAWQPATKLTEANMTEPRVATTPAGEAIVVWGPKAPSSAEAGGNAVEAAFRPPAGDFSAPVAIGPPGSIAPMLALNESGDAVATFGVPGFGVASALRPRGAGFGDPVETGQADRAAGIDAGGNATQLIYKSNYSRDAGSTARLATVTRRADGTLEQPREVARQHTILDPAIAVDEAGTTTVAWRGWNEGDGADRSRVFAATASRGEPFGAPEPLSGHYYDNGTAERGTIIAANSRGDVLVLWPALPSPNPHPGFTDPRMVHDVVGAFRPAGGSFAPPEVVPLTDPRGRGVYKWDAALGPDGDAVVAWSNAIAVTATYRPNDGQFEPGRPVAPYPGCCTGRYPPHQLQPAVAFDGSGTAMVAWATRDSDGMGLSTMRRKRGSDFDPPQIAYAGKHVFDPDIAMDHDGNAIAVWSPQERMGSDSTRDDRGVYAAFFDASAQPTLTNLGLEGRSRPTLSFEASSAGRASLLVERRLRRGYRRLFRKRLTVASGLNTVTFSRRERRALSRPGSYRATIRATDVEGTRTRVRRFRFGPL